MSPDARPFELAPRSEPDATPASEVPLVLVGCKTCGYVFGLNMLTLGIGDMFGVKSIAQEREEREAAEKPVPPLPVPPSAKRV